MPPKARKIMHWAPRRVTKGHVEGSDAKLIEDIDLTTATLDQTVEETMKPVLAHSKVTSHIDVIVSRCNETILEEIEEHA